LTLIVVTRAHSDRQADFSNLATSLLASQIALHQSILNNLLQAKQALDSGGWESGRVAIKEVAEDKVRKPLVQPSSYTLGQSQADLLGGISERMSSLLRLSVLKQAPDRV